MAAAGIGSGRERFLGSDPGKGPTRPAAPPTLPKMRRDPFWKYRKAFRFSSGQTLGIPHHLGYEIHTYRTIRETAKSSEFQDLAVRVLATIRPVSLRFSLPLPSLPGSAGQPMSVSRNANLFDGKARHRGRMGYPTKSGNDGWWDGLEEIVSGISDKKDV